MPKENAGGSPASGTKVVQGVTITPRMQRYLENEEETAENLDVGTLSMLKNHADAQDVRAKNYPIPENQKRLKSPLRVVGETDKAYIVKGTNPLDAQVSYAKAKGNDYIPKSRGTVKDGHIIGMEPWLVKKCIYKTMNGLPYDEE